MPQLFCILDEGGRALLTKTTGDIQTPSFPTVGLLCSIPTFSESAGFVVESFGTENVQIVYRRFDNHTVFVLATSNQLVGRAALQRLLQAVYDALQLLLGATLLAMDTPSAVDTLRKRLKGLPLVEQLIEDEGLVPCLMLHGPQVLGLPLRDRAALVTALTSVAAAGGTTRAALVSEGLYLAATPAWWRLQPSETLLLQHITTYLEPEATQVDMQVYLSTTGYCRPSRLLAIMLDQGVQLLLLTDSTAQVADLEPAIMQHAQRVEPIFRLPLWCQPCVPQLTSIPFDLAAVVQQGPSPCITLFWGKSRTLPQGFNPLASPTLRKQLNSPSSQAAPNLRSMSLTLDGSHNDSLQIYFKASLDLVVAFLLSTDTLQPPSAGSAPAVEPGSSPSASPTRRAYSLKGPRAVMQRAATTAPGHVPPAMEEAMPSSASHAHVAPGTLGMAGSIAGSGRRSLWAQIKGWGALHAGTAPPSENMSSWDAASSRAVSLSHENSTASQSVPHASQHVPAVGAGAEVPGQQAGKADAGMRGAGAKPAKVRKSTTVAALHAAHRLFSSFVGKASASMTGKSNAPQGPTPAEPQLDVLSNELREVNLMTVEGKRLVGLMDGEEGGISVFVCGPATLNRLDAAQAARRLRSTFCMSYGAEYA